MPMDPREQTAAEAALIRNLVETIVEPEVMGPMESIGWGHGTPPPPVQPVDNPQPAGNTSQAAPAPAPVVSGQPAPTPAPAPAVPQPVPVQDVPSGDPLAFLETMKDPNTGLYGGKYKTREEYLKGIGHVVQMSKTAFSAADAARQEADRLRQENAALRLSPGAPAPASPQPFAVSAPQAEPARNAKLDEVLSKLKTEGGILDEENVQLLIEGVRELAQTSGSQVAAQTYTERENAQKALEAKWMAVDAHMQAVAPNSLAYSSEIGLYVQSTPLVSTAVKAMIASGDLNGAAELSWELFRAAHQGQSPSQVTAASEAQRLALEAGDQARREAVEIARKNAGVASSVASGVHVAPNVAGPSQEEIDQAAAEMAAGNGTRWRSLTIGRTLTDPIFDRM